MCRNHGVYAIFLAGLITVFCGCDFIYGILQREGAEEKQILGEIPPFSHNPKVEELQEILAAYSYSPGKPDGKLGPQTREAVAAFQEDQGLKVTKFVDKATWKRIQDIERAGLIKSGQINIRAVQEALHNAGFDPGVIDGRRGPVTEEALALFQKENGLKPDGIIGKKTARMLLKYLVGYR